MKPGTNDRILIGLFGFCCALGASSAACLAALPQEGDGPPGGLLAPAVPPQDEDPASPPQDEDATSPAQPEATEARPELPEPERRVGSPRQEIRPAIAFYPELEGPSLNWFAAVVILLLSLRARPLFCWRNLDGIILALSALLLLFRDSAAAVTIGETSRTWQWWGYVALSGVTGYWFLRGVGLVYGRRAVAGDCNVSEGAMFALILAGLAIGFSTIVTAPLSASSRDGVVGGLQTLATGKLPYGDIPGYDNRSPLLYLVHAGALRVNPASITLDDGRIVTMTAENRVSWQDEPWWDTADLAAVRLVNGSLYVLMLLALLVIVARMHSTAIGLTMFVLFAVFPGSQECINRPDVMLPAVLLAWSFAAALLPGVGGLLSGALIVLAGVAWPWAWLALPVLLAFFLRKGVQGVGTIGGVLGGAIGTVAALTALTAPSLPRPNGALTSAGLAPGFAAQQDAGGTIVVERIATTSAPTKDFKSPLWSFLVESEAVKMRQTAAQNEQPAITGATGVDLASVPYRSVSTTDEARPAVQREYRAALRGQPYLTQTWASIRTVAEATWLPDQKEASTVRPPWQVWLGADAGNVDRITKIRRWVKVGAGLVSLALAVFIFVGRRSRPHHLLGGMLGVCGAALLADDLGAVANLAWLMPLVLALWAVDENGGLSGARAPVTPPPGQRYAPPSRPGPAPRITIEG